MNLVASIGLGLDIAGGYMIAIGLLGHPKSVAFRAASFTGGSPHAAAAVVESYADATLGIPIFLAGIIGQLVGNAADVHTCAWIGALSATGAAVIPLAVWRWLWRPGLSKRMAIKVACYEPVDDKTLPIERVFGVTKSRKATA